MIINIFLIFHLINNLAIDVYDGGDGDGVDGLDWDIDDDDEDWADGMEYEFVLWAINKPNITCAINDVKWLKS